VSNGDITNRFRGKVKAILAIAVALFSIFLELFISAQMLFVRADPNTWLMRLIKQHYAALIQVPAIGLMSFFGVFLFDVISEQEIEFEVLGFKFRGAAGPIVLWVLVFLAITAATYLLWPLQGLQN
jgi:hypothetical protein